MFLHPTAKKRSILVHFNVFAHNIQALSQLHVSPYDIFADTQPR